MKTVRSCDLLQVTDGINYSIWPLILSLLMDKHEQHHFIYSFDLCQLQTTINQSTVKIFCIITFHQYFSDQLSGIYFTFALFTLIHTHDNHPSE